jgi:hypothetical protein
MATSSPISKHIYAYRGTSPTRGRLALLDRPVTATPTARAGAVSLPLP